jgi:predicted deacylase
MKGLRGTLICIPIVNVYGFLHRTRYLPDRRDLNRSFPGSRNGSLAARMARTFADEVVKRSTFGIDLHTGSNHRENLPHIRADLGNETCARLARAFGAPVAINANLRDGSLRQYARELGLPMLLYEAGEALRFNRVAISAGVRGVLNVMRAIDMLPRRRSGAPPADVIVAQRSEWTRAPRTGLFRPGVQLGDHVRGDQLLGHISDATGDIEVPVKAGCTGVIVGRVNIPVVNEGDALMHIARFDDGAQSERTISSFQDLHLEGLAEGDFA